MPPKLISDSNQRESVARQPSRANSTMTPSNDMRLMLASNHPEILRNAQEMASYLLTLPASVASTRGTLELECSLGISDMSGKRVARGWKPSVPPLEAQMLLTAFERGETLWTSLDNGWRLVYDTYVLLPSPTNGGEASRARLRSIDGEPEDNIQKTLIARTDFVGRGSSPFRVRFQSSLESTITSTCQSRVLLLVPESVRVSMRRSFVLDSSSMSGIQYKYTVLKAWTGRTTKEAEILMQSSDEKSGENCIEVEVELEWPCHTPERILYACVGLLLKAQDLLDLLSGTRDMQKSSFTRILTTRKAMLPEDSTTTRGVKRTNLKRKL